eukprot:CAMPEP_0117449670 /NCGR_PEP_ID=MMETSP0759-20121206/8064_1 /TAXON_ID=63605 /ORGANISM="Percolomonas cosmopolitus, Strain WS" /LENGTH=406 /DNA_ID=CAMNT_0005242151 /DNA_START=245 /DNA_END=1465 /DNA_ORIENTATION=-
MDSTNGTFVNGEKLGKGEMRQLTNGDIVRFGFDEKSWRLQRDDYGEASSVGAGRKSSFLQAASSIHDDFSAHHRQDVLRKSSLSRTSLGQRQERSHLSPSRASSKLVTSSDDNEITIWKSTTEHLGQLEQRVGYLEDTATNHHNIESHLKRQQVTLLASIRHIAHDLSMKLSNYSVSAKVKEANSVKEMLDQIESDLELSSRKATEVIQLVNELREEKRSLKSKLADSEHRNEVLLKENDSSVRHEELERMHMQKLKSDDRIFDLESELKKKDEEIFELKEKLNETGERSLRKYHLLDVQNVELKKSNEDLRQELRSTHEYLSTVHSQLVESKSPKPKDRGSLLSVGSTDSPMKGKALNRDSLYGASANQDYVDYLRGKLDEKEEQNSQLRAKLNRISLTVDLDDI